MREWFESRSLLELKTIIEKLETIDINDENINILIDIFKKAMLTEKNRTFCFETLILLDKITDSKPCLERVIEESGKKDFLWDDMQSFANVCISMKGKSIPYLFNITFLVMGSEWFTDLCLLLPNRLWLPVTKCMKAHSIDIEVLKNKVIAKLEQKQITSDYLLWYWKTKPENKEKYVTSSTVFRALSMPVAGDFTKARNVITKMLLENDEFLSFLLGNGDRNKINIFRDLLKIYRNTVQINSAKIQSRLMNLFPDVRGEITIKKACEKLGIYPRVTSFKSYEDKRGELQALMEKEIPENSQAIAKAREYGDLRENAEYKAAKERQGYLNIRSAEISKELEDIEAIDFSNIKVADTVIHGSSVSLNVQGEDITYYILGAWDSNPEKNILSLDTDLAKSLQGLKVGDTCTLPSGKSATVTKITSVPKSILKTLSV